jgi:hypothetical protein
MKELWTRDEASFDGEWYRFPPVRSYPKPRQKPHPPIVIGAQGNRALRNVIAVGDGWMPVNYSPAELAAYLERLRNMCAAAGRDFESIEITIMRPPEGDPRRLVREYGAAGAHRILLTSDALSLSPHTAERVRGIRSRFNEASRARILWCTARPRRTARSLLLAL